MSASNPVVWSAPTRLLTALGALPPWDRYFANSASRVGDGFGAALDVPPGYSESFLRAARFTNVLITRATRDSTVDPLAIVPALNMTQEQSPERVLVGARYDGPDPNEPSEQIILEYAAVAGQWDAAERRIEFPVFEGSGHSVTMFAPTLFAQTVAAFLGKSGLE